MEQRHTERRLQHRRAAKENIYGLEKAREVGQYCLSGALLDPRSMQELESGAHPIFPRVFLCASVSLW